MVEVNFFFFVLSGALYCIAVTFSLLAMIALSTVQSFARILIHNTILFINTSTTKVQQRSLANWAAIFGDNC